LRNPKTKQPFRKRLDRVSDPKGSEPVQHGQLEGAGDEPRMIA
jgi:hypothetical protein